ncbi:MFS transporter [Sphingomonas jatrophae]|uniref:MFS-type transporter involved in bile tolerance, Atg22 family n=1 Tax=Sphingomonas jatrophae TaxID=1166337 RepID=A0A1I6JAF2_9SPHN|nr:MFS transporter [Sphingomonas jatrophae]SFR75872.1 MFS-type transporter involved in bile tolerance, Atg22 family [Sphingomonas jatrophae]
MTSLSPQPHVSDEDRERGLKLLVTEAAFSGGAAALTTGVILTAFALHLQASNAMVGVLASAPFLAQLLQLPAILLVERLRARKRISVWSSVAGRLTLAAMAGTAFFTGTVPLAIFLAAQILLCSMNAIGGCAWNAWMRDLAPEDRLGRVFARRTAWLTAINLLLGLAAATALDMTAEGSRARDTVFAGMFAAGCVTGLISALIVAAMPEPLMPPSPGPVRLWQLLRQPLRDANFVRLLRFVGSWQFAINLATPFFTVFIVRQLRFDVSFVMVLSVVSQAANIVSLRLWGVLSDRHANKSVLTVCAPAYIFAIVAMIGASQFDNRLLVAGWLILLHLVMGAAVAGVTLASTNIALKLSPKGSATAYVAANAMVTALAAGLAPILGGLFADFFSARRLELLLRWTGPRGDLALPVLLTSWDFYFLIAGALGLYAMHRLSLVAEHGEIERREMVNQVISETRRTIRNISSVAGLRAATELPASLLRDARIRIRLARARARIEQRKRGSRQGRKVSGRI